MRFDAVGIHRVAHWMWRRRVPVLPRGLDLLIFLVFNSVIHHTTEIGAGTRCAYRGMSVLIHKRARIGRNVYIGAHAVIGGRSGIQEMPQVEDDVFIGPNSCVLGPITVGAGAVIGAGAVVIRDVPARAVVAGVPARVIEGAVPRETSVRGHDG